MLDFKNLLCQIMFCMNFKEPWSNHQVTYYFHFKYDNHPHSSSDFCVVFYDLNMLSCRSRSRSCRSHCRSCRSRSCCNRSNGTLERPPRSCSCTSPLFDSVFLILNKSKNWTCQIHKFFDAGMTTRSFWDEVFQHQNLTGVWFTRYGFL